jgi:hypothetical protein
MKSVFVLLALSLSGGSALAQGCIVGRQCTPGAAGGHDFLKPHELQVGITYRSFRATDHYSGTVFQTQRRDLKNFVINRQSIFDLIATKGVNARSNVTIDLPILNSGWSSPRPLGSVVQAPGPRFNERASGIGDLSVLLKTYLKDPESHGSNVALGIGIKAPTGKAGVTNVLPDLAGNNPQPRTVDQSIQPGDGSWGIPTSLEAYKSVRGVNVFFTMNYLISPRDTNGVSSGFAPTTPSPSINVFSVPDQFLYRLGVGGAIKQVPGLSGSLSWRKEGVPQKDLIGGSHGFRRPGYSTSVEPSLSYSKGGTTYTMAVPMTLSRNSQPLNSDGRPVDSNATFARKQLIFNISRRVSL